MEVASQKKACLIGYHETCGDENRCMCIVISYQFQAWRTEPRTMGSYSLVVEDFSTEATEKLHLCCPNVLSGSPVSVLVQDPMDSLNLHLCSGQCWKGYPEKFTCFYLLCFKIVEFRH
ncbi:uncharacterized protein [Canis lupus baileyi]|uniref:uncharacterized protein isoform X1 n=1 Tax=Canis lupus baileyi TaxID=143281 RepID=UPI003B9725F5